VAKQMDIIRQEFCYLILPGIPIHSWFHKLHLFRAEIISFLRLRFGHNLLPTHAFHLLLNNFPFSTRHEDKIM